MSRKLDDILQKLNHDRIILPGSIFYVHYKLLNGFGNQEKQFHYAINFSQKSPDIKSINVHCCTSKKPENMKACYQFYFHEASDIKSPDRNKKTFLLFKVRRKLKMNDVADNLDCIHQGFLHDEVFKRNIRR